MDFHISPYIHSAGDFIYILNKRKVKVKPSPNLKKREMETKHKAAEKLLYHGTSHDVAEAICSQSFDFRLCS